MTTVAIRLTGIECEGRHGASPGERDAPQRFLVDVDVQVTFGGDSVEETVDYREIARTVRDVVANGSFALIETLADAVAGAIRAIDRDRVGTVNVTVHKPEAAERHRIADVAASQLSFEEGSSGRLEIEWDDEE
jgi:dihydroneopterin aldolase